MWRLTRSRWVLAAALAAAGVWGGCAPMQRSSPAAQGDPFGPLEWMISPTQGRPALLKAGSSLPVAFRVPTGFAGRVELRLADSILPERPNGTLTLTPGRELTVQPPAPPVPGATGPAEPEPLASGLVPVGDKLEPGLYDLVVSVLEKGKAEPLRRKVMPRSVAVYPAAMAKFRFVQLSNMSVGAATAPQFSDALVEEVNRLAPAFVITTGDYTEWASVRDDPASWRAIKEYFAKFDSPVFLMAGNLDHEAGFQQYVAQSKSGEFSFGPCQGILLYDNYHNPIDRDVAQLLWLDSVLRDSPNVGFRFLVSPNGSLRVFDAWRKLGYAPADYVRRNRIGMIFVGGYSDWDFVEHADKRGDVPIHYVRTHASSTCIRGKATGVPHYRLVQVDQSPRSGAGQASAMVGQPGQPGQWRVSFIVPEDGPIQRAQYSVPVGELKVSFDGPNDGSADRVKVTVLNRLAVPIPQLRVKVRLKNSGPMPVAVGGQIERIVDRGGVRELWLRIDCPDLGVAAAVVGPAGADSLPAPPPDLKFQFLGDPMLRYRPARAADGFSYYVTDGQVQLRMTNTASRERQFWPVIRLNGNLLSLKGLPADQPVSLAPEEQRTLPVNLPLGLASPGEHWLTVHLGDDPLPFVTARPIELIVLSEPVRTTSRPDAP